MPAPPRGTDVVSFTGMISDFIHPVFNALFIYWQVTYFHQPRQQAIRHVNINHAFSIQRPMNLPLGQRKVNVSYIFIGGQLFYSLFTLRKARSPLIINGERTFVRLNRL